VYGCFIDRYLCNLIFLNLSLSGERDEGPNIQKVGVSWSNLIQTFNIFIFDFGFNSKNKALVVIHQFHFKNLEKLQNSMSYCNWKLHVLESKQLEFVCILFI